MQNHLLFVLIKGRRHPTGSGATPIWIFVKQSIDDSFAAATQDFELGKKCNDLINESISLYKSVSGWCRLIDPGCTG